MMRLLKAKIASTKFFGISETNRKWVDPEEPSYCDVMHISST